MEVDTRLNIEFTRRYQNGILQDKQLDGASVAMVRSYFNDWIASNNGTSVAGDVRFTTCIMLDAETLVQLSEAPQNLPSDSSEYFGSQYWVKMVEAECGYEEAFRTRIFGRYDLAEYWFHRNHSRRLVVHRKNPEYPGVLYYGTAPLELTPHMQAMQDACRAYAQQHPGTGSDPTKTWLWS
ncbi:Ff.00g133650.m01.CDS01 [Fusarium sp. VM40]|nr:Ff.00g133650.m01.CDS01 [Fusarium sp. VM40]